MALRAAPALNVQPTSPSRGWIGARLLSALALPAGATQQPPDHVSGPEADDGTKRNGCLRDEPRLGYFHVRSAVLDMFRESQDMRSPSGARPIAAPGDLAFERGSTSFHPYLSQPLLGFLGRKEGRAGGWR